MARRGLLDAIEPAPEEGVQVAGMGSMIRGLMERLARDPGEAYRAGPGTRGAPLTPVSETTGTMRGFRGVPGKPLSRAIPGYGDVEMRPIGLLDDAAERYNRERGLGEHYIKAFPELDVERTRRIAAAFDRMKNAPQDPAVRRAYDAMISETLDQYKAIEDLGIDIRFMQQDSSGNFIDPYAADPALGYVDLINNGRLYTLPTDAGFGSDADVLTNPLLKRVGRIGDLENATANDAFRVVHDMFGHFAPGNPFFRPKGEERAWLQHSRMYSPEARGAMSTETRGQNSWLNFGPHAEHNKMASGADTIYAPQKVGLLPEEFWNDESGKLRRDWSTMAVPAAAIAAYLAMEEGDVAP